MTQNGKGIPHAVADVFVQQLEVEVPTPETDLFATGILDSLRFVELLAALEERFAIEVSLEDIEIDDFRTLSRIGEFVAGRQVRSRG
jgi:methoxymalonate biosynthesis acyl carrier protein